VHSALEQMATERPRPVEIEVPWDVLPATADADLPEREVFPKQPSEPAQVKEAMEILSQTSRPLICSRRYCPIRKSFRSTPAPRRLAATCW